MRITRLRIRNLQRHQDLDVELAPGITILRGPNESGKTTVQRAIELALFRKVTSTGSEMESLRRWGGGDAPPSVELEFSDHEEGSGRLVKVFAGSKGQARLEQGGETIEDPTAVDRRLAELTGLPSDKFFHSTASVHHHELDRLAKDEAALRDRLQASMSVDARGTSQARKKLQEAIHRYAREGAKNPGQLLQDRDRVADLERQSAEGEAALQQLASDQARLSTARQTHAAAESRLVEDRQQLSLSEQAVELKARQTEASARYERYKRAAELRDEIVTRDAAHPSRIELSQLQTAVERLRAQEQTISKLHADLADEPDVSSYDVGALPTPRWRRWALLGLLLAAVGSWPAWACCCASWPSSSSAAATTSAGRRS
jgi:DNA repair exonuclease SbcCD ATPase subunit